MGKAHEAKFIPTPMRGICEVCSRVDCGREGYVDAAFVVNVGRTCAEKIAKAIGYVPAPVLAPAKSPTRRAAA